jgi:hypothetical protein
MDEMEKIKKLNFFLMAVEGCLLFTVLGFIQGLDAAQPDKGLSEQIVLSENRLALLRKTAEKLKALADDPVPQKLPPDVQKEFNTYSKWLKNAVGQLNILTSRLETYLQNKGLSPPKREMKHDPQVPEDLRLLNLQYLLLRNKIYQENKDFQMSSNFLKKKRETVRSLIIHLK